MNNRLISSILERSASISVIGLGYVGLPLAVAFAEKGFRVIGIDTDQAKVDALNRGESYVQDIPSCRLAALTRAEGVHCREGDSQKACTGEFVATTHYAALEACDVAIVAVPTPLNKTHDPDVRFVIAAGEALAQHIHPGMLIVLESTTYPGTTDELLLPILTTESGLSVGENLFIAFSPERIDPGNRRFSIENTPKVVGGVTPACREVAAKLYGQIIEKIVPVSSTQTAEMVKLLENTFRAVNIALVNEIAIMCDKLGIDVWEVIEAADSKPYGFMKFTPGPGVGGHCIPLDPFYLSWKLRTLNYNARFIQLAGEINSAMPRYWVEKASDLLNREGRSVKGSRILVLGVAYKKDIGDVRESPALDVIELLRKKGADVVFHDPYVFTIFHNGLQLNCTSDLDHAVQQADCVLIITDHSTYDWSWIAQHARNIVDTRHVNMADGSI